MAPEVVAPGHEHLGLFCVNCGKSFSLIGPLDPDKVPADKPLNIRARTPVLHGTCSHCGHKADYPIEQLRRLSLS
jgi:DNA-directed RNA polymerase subunit RPC12/RpoP